MIITLQHLQEVHETTRKTPMPQEENSSRLITMSNVHKQISFMNGNGMTFGTNSF
jgi:hypothetical protein